MQAVVCHGADLLFFGVAAVRREEDGGMGLAGAADIAFGPFRLFARERALRCGRRPVALSGRAFDLLLALVEADARVVSKDELMMQVWGGLVVAENNLHVQIARVRRALGGERDYIQTVSGRGYRFVGEVRRPAARPNAVGEGEATLALSAALASLGDLARAGPADEVARRIAAAGSASRIALEARSADRYLVQLLDALEGHHEPRSFRPAAPPANWRPGPSP